MRHIAIGFKKRLYIHLRDEWRCFYCHILMDPLSDDLTIDHVDPDGSNEEDNLVTCCISCNIQKSDSDVDDFLLARSRKGFDCAKVPILTCVNPHFSVEDCEYPVNVTS